MNNLTTPQVLPAQYQPTDEDLLNIEAAGLRLVHRPTVKLWDESNNLRTQMCVSAEAD